MTRRIISKAYNDLVGGGTESISINPELPKQSSVLRLCSKDVPHSNRLGVEIKPTEGQREPSKLALETGHPVSTRENVGRAHFVLIDGEDSVKQVEDKRVSETAYKARSFMSAVDLSLRGRPPTHVNPNVGRQPMRKPDVPKASNSPDDVRMFLPKGINNSNQPYVVPKFMPPYREMMAPKPKPDPLVSIVERTPPSLQKWAVEWNSEPRKTISIDELKEDLLREAAEKTLKPPGMNAGLLPVHESDETHEDEQLDQHRQEHHKESGAPEMYPNHSENTFTPPWKDANIPLSSEDARESPKVRDHESKPLKIGKPLVDWRPPKYCGRSRYVDDPKNKEYSFQEAIKKGTPNVPKPDSNPESKLFFRKPAKNPIYCDTEEQKFHEWFKERMSAAVKSAHHASELKTNAFALSKAPSRPNSTAAPKSPSRQNKITLAERNPINEGPSSGQIYSNGLTPREAPDRPKSSNVIPPKPVETERNSSFYHWLKLRGHHIVKHEQSLQENKKAKEKTNQDIQNPKFPWSVSYTLRRRVSTPNVPTNRPASLKNLKKSPKTASHGIGRRQSSKILKKYHETVSREGLRQPSPKNRRTLQNKVSQNGMPEKHDRSDSSRPDNSSEPISKNNDGKKFAKANSKRSYNSEKGADKKPSRGAGKASVGNSTKKTAKTDIPRLPLASDHLWCTDSWHVDSEMDHINHLRKMETYGKYSKVVNSKKNFPSTGPPQMKYWESKYTQKPAFAHRATSVDGAAKEYSWMKYKKASDYNKNNLKEVDRPNNNVERGARNSNLFTEVAESSSLASPISQNAKQSNKQDLSPDLNPDWAPVMDFSKDFDVGRFLSKEESAEEELLESSQEKRENKAEGVENRETERPTKVKGKEHIRFPRLVKVRTESDADSNLRKRAEQKFTEDDFLMALGEDPGMEDLEWSEFIGGPRNSFDYDSDLSKMMGTQARQLGSVQNACL